MKRLAITFRYGQPGVDGSPQSARSFRGTEEPAVRHGLNTRSWASTPPTRSFRARHASRGVDEARKNEPTLGLDHFGVWSGSLESGSDLDDSSFTNEDVAVGLVPDAGSMVTT